MEEKIDMNRYPNRYGTKINIGFTFNNKTPRFTHAPNHVTLDTMCSHQFRICSRVVPM